MGDFLKIHIIGVEVTKAPSVELLWKLCWCSNMHIISLKSQQHLLGVPAARLRRHLIDMNVIFHRQAVFFSFMMTSWNGTISALPVTRSFDIFFDLHLKKRLSKQSWGWWFETPSRSLWRQCNALGKEETNGTEKIDLVTHPRLSCVSP